MHEPKLRERLQYAFDTVMSRGTVAIMGLLALGTLVFVFVIALIVMLLKAFPEDAQEGDFWDIVWGNLMRTLDPGTMGADIARFDDCSIAWTVLYDELIVTLEGKFRLRVGDEVFDTVPGDVLWVPKGTALAYEGDGATVFYALDPVDWRTRQA